MNTNLMQCRCQQELQSKLLYGPFAEGVGFDAEKAGRSPPVAVLAPDRLFVTCLFQVFDAGVQVQTFRLRLAMALPACHLVCSLHGQKVQPAYFSSSRSYPDTGFDRWPYRPTSDPHVVICLQIQPDIW